MTANLGRVRRIGAPLLLVLCLPLIAAGQAQKPPQQVTVVNPDTSPVPVKAMNTVTVWNVDQPGRTPWSTRSQVLPGSGCYGTSDCFNYYEYTGLASTFDLRPVPAGKIWVVQSATGGFANGQGRTTSIELRNNRTNLVFDGAKWLFGGPYSSYTDFDATIFNSTMFVTFGPGETPVVRVIGSPTLVGYFVIAFNGYLIDAPEGGAAGPAAAAAPLSSTPESSGRLEMQNGMLVPVGIEPPGRKAPAALPAPKKPEN